MFRRRPCHTKKHPPVLRHLPSLPKGSESLNRASHKRRLRPKSGERRFARPKCKSEDTTTQVSISPRLDYSQSLGNWYHFLDSLVSTHLLNLQLAQDFGTQLSPISVLVPLPLHILKLAVSQVLHTLILEETGPIDPLPL